MWSAVFVAASAVGTESTGSGSGQALRSVANQDTGFVPFTSYDASVNINSTDLPDFIGGFRLGKMSNRKISNLGSSLPRFSAGSVNVTGQDPLTPHQCLGKCMITNPVVNTEIQAIAMNIDNLEIYTQHCYCSRELPTPLPSENYPAQTGWIMYVVEPDVPPTAAASPPSPPCPDRMKDGEVAGIAIGSAAVAAVLAVGAVLLCRRAGFGGAAGSGGYATW